VAINRRKNTSTKKNRLRKVGRPNLFSWKYAEDLCKWLAEGKSLTKWCRKEANPSYSTVMRWLWMPSDIKEEFNKMYERARKQQAEYFVDDTVDIADDGLNDFIEKKDEKGNTRVLFNKEHVLRSKLRVDTRKWAASKLEPKKYGDSSQLKLTDGDGGPITLTVKYEDRKILSGEEELDEET